MYISSACASVDWSWLVLIGGETLIGCVFRRGGDVKIEVRIVSRWERTGQRINLLPHRLLLPGIERQRRCAVGRICYKCTIVTYEYMRARSMHKDEAERNSPCSLSTFVLSGMASGEMQHNNKIGHTHAKSEQCCPKRGRGLYVFGRQTFDYRFAQFRILYQSISLLLCCCAVAPYLFDFVLALAIHRLGVYALWKPIDDFPYWFMVQSKVEGYCRPLGYIWPLQVRSRINEDDDM